MGHSTAEAIGGTMPITPTEASSHLRLPSRPTPADSIEDNFRRSGAAAHLLHVSAFEFATRNFWKDDKNIPLDLDLPSLVESSLDPSLNLEHVVPSPAISSRDSLEANMHVSIPRFTTPGNAINSSLRSLITEAALMRCSVLIRHGYQNFGILNHTDRAEVMDHFAKIVHIASEVALPIAKSIGNKTLEARSCYWAGRARAGQGEWKKSLGFFQQACQIHAEERLEELEHDFHDLKYWLREVKSRTVDTGLSRQSSFHKRDHSNHQRNLRREPMISAHLPSDWDITAEQDYIRSLNFLPTPLQFIMSEIPGKAISKTGAEAPRADIMNCE